MKIVFEHISKGNNGVCVSLKKSRITAKER